MNNIRLALSPRAFGSYHQFSAFDHVCNCDLRLPVQPASKEEACSVTSHDNANIADLP